MFFFSRKETPKWHEGDDWKRALDLYDELAQEQFGPLQDRESRYITTTFGETQIHACGCPKNPPVIFFHGIGGNSLMFGDWLIPPLISQNYYTVAVDTLGDMGRSCPKDGDPSNCPQNDEQMADWARQVLDGLQIMSRKVCIVGYSLGAYIGACLAKHCPDRVHKIVLVAPAGVVGNIQMPWLARIIAFGVLLKMVPAESSFADSLRNWILGYMMADPASVQNLPRRELRRASEAVGPAQVGVRPVAFDDQTLAELNKRIPFLLIIGEQETVLDPKAAVVNAEKAGFKVKVFEKAGHMIYCEPPRDDVVEEIGTFLSGA